ncbi:MAG TPA: glycerate kinase, partial [Leeuwenhoekiella sp.]|nr:glycerate kinase [Leeuwenhoekiella sp.]
LTVACDVSNLLLGATGAATIYAPQKGATPAQVTALEKGAEHLAQIIQQKTGRTITSIAGGGAAGGTAAGMYGFFNSKLEPGFELLSKLANLEERVKQADLIITGEGKTDNQSQYGKVPFKLAELARKHNKPLYLFAGSVQADQNVLTAAGITKAIAIKTETMALEYAKTNAFELLKNAVAHHLKTQL